MIYKICINCPVEKPEERDIVSRIIDVAAEAGAGKVGNYARVAVVLDGSETWRTESGAHPYNGAIGQITVAKSVRIEMQCSAENAANVISAIRKIHPYEEPVIELVRLEDLPE